MNDKNSVLEVKHLNLSLNIDGKDYQVLDDVNFTLYENSILGIVGESGSGKSLTALSILGMLPTGAKLTGEIIYNGQNLVGLSERAFRQLRTNEISMIFQEPSLALNPLMKVGKQVEEALRFDRSDNDGNYRVRVENMLEEVGLSKDVYHSYPHELSGGMKQRVIIAIALICDPNIIIADEPTTALDATIQKQILELLREVMKKRSGSMILISHDLGVISQMCDDCLVMYAGRIVESGSKDDVIHRSSHPYTKALLHAIPSVANRNQLLFSIPFSVPSLTERAGLEWPFLSTDDYDKDTLSEYFPEVYGGEARANEDD